MLPGENTMLVPTESICAADEARVLCMVRDLTQTDNVTIRCTLNLPGSTTAAEMIDEVACKLGYEAYSFNLIYENTNEKELKEINLEVCKELTLAEIVVGGSKRNNFNITEKDGIPVKKVESREGVENSLSPSSLTLGATASALSDNKDLGTYGTYGPYTSSSSYLSDYSYASVLIKSETGFVGLVNQAMTCYLNSLLQTLYMTPEFRNAVYRWEFEPSTCEEAVKSIPYQLQRLFLQLQTSKRKAIETTDITRSFGWDSSEAWQQHDVQELCRVMFDALEKKWKNTDQSDLINKLYSGKLKDYVKCLECGNESSREDTYLDIPLVIRPFGSNRSYGSVAEALDAFVEPETLDGNNQYFCEKCNKKCDAHKGLKFMTFPYLLTLQLKRFDFDYTTLHRIKLNDKMTFSEVMDLNRLVDEKRGQETDGEVKGQPPPDSADQASGSDQYDEAVDEGIEIGYSASGTTTNSESSESFSSSEAAANDRNLQESKYTGPYVYELFSIMIHSGSAAGGHYYAYVKSFKDKRWYSFNDQHVSTITQDDIRKVFGGSTAVRGYYSSAYASSTNAYMLMYRRVDKDRNKNFIQVDEYPVHLKQELDKINRREEDDRRQREIEKSMCKIKLFCFHPVRQKLLESRFEIHKDKTLKEATEDAWKLFELEDIVPLDCVRIVKYDELHDSLEQSYEDQEYTHMDRLLGGVKTYMFDLLLEIKRKDQQFQPYTPGGVTVKVYEVDLESETIGSPVSVRTCQNRTVTEFKQLIGQQCNLPADKMRCVLERTYSELRLLAVGSKTLKSEGFFRGNKVFIECSGTEDDIRTSFPFTKLYRLLDRFENTIRITVDLPPLKAVPPVCDESGSSREESPADGAGDRSRSSVGAEQSQDVDEGIVDSVTDTRTKTDGDLTEGDVSSENGPLRSSNPMSREDIHSSISETIHRQNLESTRDSMGQEGQDSQTESDKKDYNTPIYCEVDETTASAPKPADTSDEADTKSGMKMDHFGIPATEDWDAEVSREQIKHPAEEECRKYFRASLHINSETSERSLTVYVDKRISLGALKKELVQFVGVPPDYFKVYRVYGNNQEFESTRLTETLTSYGDDSKLNVKYGRALKKGEYRVKVYQLLLNEQEPCKFLMDTIFAKGLTVLQSKQMICDELRKSHNLDVPVERCRLRKKSWKNPGTVFVDSQVYDDDIPIFANWEIFLQVLDDAEPMTSLQQVAVFLRRWWPSKYEIGPLEEIILDSSVVTELTLKISRISGIPAENIDFAKGRGSFPYEVSLLEVHGDLDWNPQVTTLNMFPLHICDDGHIIIYRDSKEPLMELSEERKREIQQKENARLSKLSTRLVYSPRKERALKIYTDDPPSSSTPSSTHELD